MEKVNEQHYQLVLCMKVILKRTILKEGVNILPLVVSFMKVILKRTGWTEKVY